MNWTNYDNFLTISMVLFCQIFDPIDFRICFIVLHHLKMYLLYFWQNGRQIRQKPRTNETNKCESGCIVAIYCVQLYQMEMVFAL